MGVDRRVSHMLDNCGEKIREARKGVVAAEMDQGMYVVLVVGQPGKNLTNVKSVFSCTVDCLKTLSRSGLFGLGEELRGTGGVGEEEEDNYCK